MQPYITQARVNLPEGIFTSELSFSKGLNFISGENGTGKSKVLGFIKDNLNNGSGTMEVSEGGSIPNERVAFYNPKRSNQKREVQGLLARMNQENKTIQSLKQQLNQSYSDQAFVEYPAFSDLFVITVEDAIKIQSKSPPDAVALIQKDIDLVLEKIMPEIKATATWQVNGGIGEATLVLTKYGKQLSPMQLSVGENEILSLALSVYLLRDANDLYLIDEPEVHLNWSFEKQLFDYLDWFAKEYNKQLIVVSHSPVVFEQKFAQQCHFLNWEGGRVISSTTPTEDITNKLASRVAATFIGFDNAYDQTFFVEDNMHKLAVETIANKIGKNVRVVICGSKSKVIQLHKAIEPKLARASYVVDGDNEDLYNASFGTDLFALKKYCIDNYFLNPEILVTISKKPNYNTLLRVQRLLLTLTQTDQNKNFTSRYKAYIELSRVDRNRFFKLIDTMDGSEYLSRMELYKKLGYPNLTDFVEAYIDELSNRKELKKVFKEITSRLT